MYVPKCLRWKACFSLACAWGSPSGPPLPPCHFPAVSVKGSLGAFGRWLFSEGALLWHRLLGGSSAPAAYPLCRPLADQDALCPSATCRAAVPERSGGVGGGPGTPGCGAQGNPKAPTVPSTSANSRTRCLFPRTLNAAGHPESWRSGFGRSFAIWVPLPLRFPVDQPRLYIHSVTELT